MPACGRWPPRVESVTLMGARLVVRRLPTGNTLATGLGGPAGHDLGMLRFFLGHGRFQLVDSELSWIDEESGAPPLRLSGVRVRFENRGEGHRIGVFAEELDGRPVRLRLVGEVRGAPARPTDWRGGLYLHWRGTDLGRALAGWLPAGLHLGSEAVALESWSRLEAGRIDRSLNRIEVAGLRLGDGSATEAAEAAPWRLERLTGLLRWRRVGTGWQFTGRELALTRDGVRRPVSDLGIRLARAGDGGWVLTGGSRVLDLADVRDLLTRLPWLPPEVRHRLTATRPGGELSDPRFRFAHRPGLPLRWAVSGRVEDLSLDAQGDFPGIRGLTAELAANERAGRLVLADDDLVLNLPRLFPHPLGLNRAAGTIRWQREDDGALRIGAEEVWVGNADITTRSRFSLVLPAAGGSPFLDLHTEFRELEVARISDYLPSRRLKKKLVAWLERAPVGGRIPAGALLFRGALADFPFDEQQGRFEVLFSVQDGILAFHPEWPRVEALAGEIRFENRGLQASVTQGRFLDSDLVTVSLGVPDLGRAVAVEIQGRAEGPFADVLRVLGETPLRKRFGALARALETQGKARLALDLSIPLRHRGREGPLRLTGKLSWPAPDAAVLTLVEQRLELTHLAGQLRFTERTLKAKSLKARLWGVPIDLRLATRRSGKQPTATARLRAEGRFPTTVLARQFPSRLWQPLQGRTPLALDLEFTEANLGRSLPPLDFTLSSDLAGLVLRLPAPLGKSAAETRRLRLSGRLVPDQPLALQGAYGDLGIRLGWDRERDGEHRLARGIFTLGGPPQPHPEPPGFHLTGTVADLDLTPWLAWWADRKPPGNGDPAKSIGLHAARVRIGRLRLAGTALHEVDLALDRRQDHWQAKLQARELAGKATLPHRPRREPLRVRLARLDLKGMLGPNQPEGKTPAPEPPADPRRAHTLDLRIEQLRWGKNPLGSLTLRSRAVPGGLKFTTLALTGAHLSLTGKGSWRWANAGPRSAFSLTAQGRDLGRFLRSLELESLFQEAPGTLNLDLSWPGAPGRFAAAELQGRIRIDLGAGRLLDVEPGVGRILGLLNLGVLRRRLALDFNDLFGRGYDFERIAGRIQIHKGVATIEELLIEGPSADLGITGNAHLVTRELDQIVTVTPHLGASVAVAGAVAGGPLVGAAVFAVDKVSGGAVDRLGRHQYHLSGPWTRPRIQRGSRPDKTSAADPGAESPTSREDTTENLFLEGN